MMFVTAESVCRSVIEHENRKYGSFYDAGNGILPKLTLPLET